MPELPYIEHITIFHHYSTVFCRRQKRYFPLTVGIEALVIDDVKIMAFPWIVPVADVRQDEVVCAVVLNECRQCVLNSRHELQSQPADMSDKFLATVYKVQLIDLIGTVQIDMLRYIPGGTDGERKAVSIIKCSRIYRR